jgi:hypothetical protein
LGHLQFSSFLICQQCPGAVWIYHRSVSDLEVSCLTVVLVGLVVVVFHWVVTVTVGCPVALMTVMVVLVMVSVLVMGVYWIAIVMVLALLD